MGKRKQHKRSTLDLPEQFKERLGLMLRPSDLIATLGSFSKKRHTTFRVNTLKTDPLSVQKWLQNHGISFVRHNLVNIAFSLPKTSSKEVAEWDLYKEGKIYLQNLSSMIPPIILDPQPGESVLDLTAAPGSKTTQIAALMEKEGLLVANEKNFPRFKRLEANVEMQVGSGFIELHNTPGELFAKEFTEKFDRVLLDAPCSSEGQFSLLQPKTLRYWAPHKIKNIAYSQNNLLIAAINACKPGGLIIYSTCTYGPEENEVVVDKMLKKFSPNLKLEPINIPLSNIRQGLTHWKEKQLDPSLKLTARILPNQDFEGFFAAKIRKLPVSPPLLNF